MKVNPTRMMWADPTTYTDGSAFGAADFQAYELGVGDGTGAVTALLALPVAFGVGESPIPDAVRDNVGPVQWIHLRTLDNYGGVSAWSNGVDVRFTSAPFPPSGLEAG